MTPGILPLVSVVIPTYGREQVLCQTIQHILRQDYPRFELIIVDQTEAHEPETETFLNEHKDKLRLIHLGRASLPFARNIGTLAAKGEIVLFADDDVIPEPGWIGYHADNYFDGSIGGVGGRVVEARDKPLETRNVGKISCWGKIVRNYTSIHRVSIATAQGNNMSFRRSVIKDAGFFDERFIGYAQLEETDLCYRVRKMGYSLVFDPRAQVFHLNYPRGGCRNQAARNTSRLEWYYYYFHNKTLFFLKNMRRIYLPLYLSTHFLIAVREGLFRARSMSGLVYLLGAFAAGCRAYNTTGDTGITMSVNSPY